jgi:hypothetical protein
MDWERLRERLFRATSKPCQAGDSLSATPHESEYCPFVCPESWGVEALRRARLLIHLYATEF